MGTTLRELIHGVGGGPGPGRTITTLAVGGPSSGVMSPDMIDTPIMPGSMHESGVMLGAGGVVPLDERLEVLDVVRDLAAYNADESCGKCTPCREGTPLQVAALDRVISGAGSGKDIEELKHLANVINAASLCNLGQLAGNPVLSALHFFGDAFENRVESRGG
jgi:NADH:ubiquinone oxidoreductase subunit F (NADH-binding)